MYPMRVLPALQFLICLTIANVIRNPIPTSGTDIWGTDQVPTSLSRGNGSGLIAINRSAASAFKSFNSEPAAPLTARQEHWNPSNIPSIHRTLSGATLSTPTAPAKSTIIINPIYAQAQLWLAGPIIGSVTGAAIIGVLIYVYGVKRKELARAAAGDNVLGNAFGTIVDTADGAGRDTVGFHKFGSVGESTLGNTTVRERVAQGEGFCWEMEGRGQGRKRVEMAERGEEEDENGDDEVDVTDWELRGGFGKSMKSNGGKTDAVTALTQLKQTYQSERGQRKDDNQDLTDEWFRGF